MSSLRIWIVLSWIALPTVMFGGYSLLRLIVLTAPGDVDAKGRDWRRQAYEENA